MFFQNCSQYCGLYGFFTLVPRMICLFCFRYIWEKGNFSCSRSVQTANKSWLPPLPLCCMALSTRDTVNSPIFWQPSRPDSDQKFLTHIWVAYILRGVVDVQKVLWNKYAGEICQSSSFAVWSDREGAQIDSKPRATRIFDFYPLAGLRRASPPPLTVAPKNTGSSYQYF